MCAAFFPESNLGVVTALAGDVYKIGKENDEAWQRTVAILHKKPAQMTEAAMDFLEFLMEFFRER